MCFTKIQSTFYLALIIFFKFTSTFPTVTPVFNLVVMLCLSFFLETSDCSCKYCAKHCLRVLFVGYNLDILSLEVLMY